MVADRTSSRKEDSEVATKAERGALGRRRFIASAAGIAGAIATSPNALFGATKAPLTSAILRDAAHVAGLELDDAERELMLKGVDERRADYAALRAVDLPNGIPPALRFSPTLPSMPSMEALREPSSMRASVATLPSFSAIEQLAFEPVTVLGRLLRERKVTSEQLTRMYLGRLRQHDAALRCVITLTEERAIAQAKQADRELAAGRYRGPLHGVPWGVKDLLAVRGYPTTWGAQPFRDQVIDIDATVVRRLDDAGAVLLAKLSVGALAWGDVWFDATTRNPWNTEQGSSGSSAGPASATAAGLVGFAIGTETWGSIVSPCTRCGVTGLRPTFGRVSRHGAMALSWSMDKVGPIARSVEDCALVLDAIGGPDGEDGTVVDAPFAWDAGRDIEELRVGYVPSHFDTEPEDDEQREAHAHDRASLAALRELGVQLQPMSLPSLPVSSLSFILSAEAAAAFDELTRSGRDAELVRQVEQAWPNVFRQARLIPAVEYIQANRVRTLVMRELDRLMAEVDLYITPTFAGDNLLLTNLTGHPQVVVPNGFRKDGTPTSITFTGRLFEEGKLLAVARAWQDATGFHRRHPKL